MFCWKKITNLLEKNYCLWLFNGGLLREFQHSVNGVTHCHVWVRWNSDAKTMDIPHFPPQINQWIKARKHDIPQRNINYLLALSCVLALTYVPALVLILHEWKGKTMNIPYFPPSVSQWNEAPKMTFRRWIAATFWRPDVCPCVLPGSLYVEFREWFTQDTKRMNIPYFPPVERGRQTWHFIAE
jgi:hypothetical protein